MEILITFWVMTAACCMFAVWFGGHVEKIGAVILATKTLLGFSAGLYDQTWTHVSWPVFTVDVMAVLAFTWLSLRSDRYWPLWAAGYSLAAVAVHLAAATDVGFRPAVYHGIKGLIALPMECTIMFGIYLDYRRNITGRLR